MRTSLLLAGIYATISVIATPITPPPTNLNAAKPEPLAQDLDGPDIDGDASSMAVPKPATGWPGYERPNNKNPPPSTKDEPQQWRPKLDKLQPRPRPHNPFKNPKWRTPPNDPNTFKNRNPFRSWPDRDPFKMPKKNPFKLPEKKVEPKPEPEVNIEPMPKLPEQNDAKPEQKDAKPERYPTLEELIQQNAQPARYPTHEEWTEQSKEMAIANNFEPWHGNDKSPDAAPENEPTYEPHEYDARRVGN
ncbi:hypothetical protein CSIM01_11259 [Colletotrichum simmondsii]|uniref:Uncharacterized protein n=1 Tax=Colletotrichum simmondsii TaxID=703756 RepID=A0A135RUB2_9PEZI|nr:hypothetical protein CSIM01_11259 [Colletotrichum simmondsii]